MWAWNRSLSIISRRDCKSLTTEYFTNLKSCSFWNTGTKSWKQICTLCWAKIKTLCCPTKRGLLELDTSKPIPHSSRISWRATNLGEWCSVCSSVRWSVQPGIASEMMSLRASGGLSPMTSNGWLQSFSRYCSAWI